MPRYDYICPANARVLEVSHPMSHTVRDWGELCAMADASCGRTDPREPVERLIGGAIVLSRPRHRGAGHGPAAGGSCCGLPGC